MRDTRRTFKDILNALHLTGYHKPLVCIDKEALDKGTVQIHPSITKAISFLEDALKPSAGRRGNVKIELEVPEELKIKAVNDAIRWGFPEYESRYHKDEEIRDIDIAYSVALSNLFTGKTGTTFTHLTTAELEEV